MATFRSRYNAHVLVMKPSRRFERDGQIISEAGHRIEFANGMYTTDDQEEIKFLRKHRDFGVVLFEEAEANAPSDSDEDTTDSVYVCEECGKEFSTRQGLASHARAHKREDEEK